MDHEEAKLVLAELVSGRLSPERAAAVRDHVASCAECREAMATMRLVSEEARYRRPLGNRQTLPAPVAAPERPRPRPSPAHNLSKTALRRGHGPPSAPFSTPSKH